uniref:VQ domain-containing protein n=2 Tax=Setaria italica TaxID=4555 RepID=K3Y3M3_SETIT
FRRSFPAAGDLGEQVLGRPAAPPPHRTNARSPVKWTASWYVPAEIPIRIQDASPCGSDVTAASKPTKPGTAAGCQRRRRGGTGRPRHGGVDPTHLCHVPLVGGPQQAGGRISDASRKVGKLPRGKAAIKLHDRDASADPGRRTEAHGDPTNGDVRLTSPGSSSRSDQPAAMAMSDTGSSFAQWAELYHHDPSLPTADDTVAAGSPGDMFAAATAAASPPTSGGSGGSPTKAAAAAHHQQLGIDGPRVGKPARRRSRASRRAPVTLLNTDTANFRAMVQQFTGIPAPPAGAFGGPVINFAGDYGFPPSSGVMSFDHHHHNLHRSHGAPPPAVPLQDQLLRRQQQYTGGAFGGYNSSLLHGGGGDLFASHGLASAEDRMLLQSIQQAAAAHHHHMPPASAANAAGATGFFA